MSHLANHRIGLLEDRLDDVERRIGELEKPKPPYPNVQSLRDIVEEIPAPRPRRGGPLYKKLAAASFRKT